mgnify:CR=1 FL=1
MEDDIKRYSVLIESGDKIKLFKTFENKTTAEHWRDVISLFNPYKRTWVEEIGQEQKSIQAPKGKSAQS